MDMEYIARLGPLAVALGTFVEGETALILAGGAMALGLLDFWPVVLADLAGSLAGDQCFFWLGRLQGASFLAKRPRFAALVSKVGTHIMRHRLPLLMGYRFVYGLRGAVPFAFGVTDLCWKYFLAANVITATFWSVLMAGLSLHAGHLLAGGHVALFAAAVAGVLGLVWLALRRMSKKAS